MLVTGWRFARPPTPNRSRLQRPRCPPRPPRGPPRPGPAPHGPPKAGRRASGDAGPGAEGRHPPPPGVSQGPGSAGAVGGRAPRGGKQTQRRGSWAPALEASRRRGRPTRYPTPLRWRWSRPRPVPLRPPSAPGRPRPPSPPPFLPTSLEPTPRASGERGRGKSPVLVWRAKTFLAFAPFRGRAPANADLVSSDAPQRRLPRAPPDSARGDVGGPEWTSTAQSPERTPSPKGLHQGPARGWRV